MTSTTVYFPILNPFEKEFTLCYRKNKTGFDTNLICERGFKTVEEIDKRAESLGQYNTTFFSGYKLTPNIIRSRMIQMKLRSRVTLEK